MVIQAKSKMAGLPTVSSFRFKPAELSLPARILRAYYRTNLRGWTRLTFMLARRLKSLQEVPVQIADWPPVYADLRLMNSHYWFLGTPFANSPIEIDEQMVMRRFVSEGDVVFDIGANLGVHTALLSQLAGSGGRVFAFEPNPELTHTLALTIEGMPNASLFRFALSDEDGEATFFVPRDHAMGSLSDWTATEPMAALRERLALGKARAISVQQRRIDDLIAEGILPLPDFIKCDVEGAELKVFRGAKETLDRIAAPVILFEAGPESAGGFGLAMTDAADFLGSLPHPGYRFFEIGKGGALRAVQPSELKKQNQNLLAVPGARS
jgi:FkbM family methyltransferase